MAGLSKFLSGQKGTKMVSPSGYYHLGPFWGHQLLNHYKTIGYLLWSTSARPYMSISGQKFICPKWSKGVQMGPLGSHMTLIWIMNIWIRADCRGIRFGSFFAWSSMSQAFPTLTTNHWKQNPPLGIPSPLPLKLIKTPKLWEKDPIKTHFFVK